MSAQIVTAYSATGVPENVPEPFTAIAFRHSTVLRLKGGGANGRAVQSTPVVGRDGAVLGVLSTHTRRPRVPKQKELRLIDYYAEQAAILVEWCHR